MPLRVKIAEFWRPEGRAGLRTTEIYQPDGFNKILRYGAALAPNGKIFDSRSGRTDQTS